MIKSIKGILIYLGSYELVRTTWETIDTFQGIEFVTTMANSLACATLSCMLAIWLVKDFR